MDLSTFLGLTAFAAAVLLALPRKTRGWAIAAAVASALEVAVALGWIRLEIPGISLGLLLGALVAGTGVVLFLKVRDRLQVAAATLLSFVGLLQVLLGLGFL